jgi:hypothetical protein
MVAGDRRTGNGHRPDIVKLDGPPRLDWLPVKRRGLDAHGAAVVRKRSSLAVVTLFVNTLFWIVRGYAGRARDGWRRRDCRCAAAGERQPEMVTAGAVMSAAGPDVVMFIDAAPGR